MLAAFHAGGGGFADWPDLAPGLVPTPAGLRPDPGPPVTLKPHDARLVTGAGRPPRLRPPRVPRAPRTGPPEAAPPRRTASERELDAALKRLEAQRQSMGNGQKLVRERTPHGVRVRWV
jgi:hypothetical protein